MNTNGHECVETNLAPAGVKVNQEFFDRLPALLTPYQMRLVTGLGTKELRALEEAQDVRVWRARPRTGCKQTYRKYYKTDAARLTGFRM